MAGQEVRALHPHCGKARRPTRPTLNPKSPSPMRHVHRTAFLERCESAVLRPLASWYSLHGYPHLVNPNASPNAAAAAAQQQQQPGRRGAPPRPSDGAPPPHHAAAHEQPPGRPPRLGLAAPAAAWGPRAPQLRPGGLGAWPSPLHGPDGAGGASALGVSPHGAGERWACGSML